MRKLKQPFVVAVDNLESFYRPVGELVPVLPSVCTPGVDLPLPDTLPIAFRQKFELASQVVST